MTAGGPRSGALEDARADLPSGTVTFLFTDIEGSTRIIQALGDRYPAILVDHRAIVETAIGREGGHVFGYDGDAIFAVFERATPAIEAAAELVVTSTV